MDKFDRVMFIITAFIFGLAATNGHALVAATCAAFLASDIIKLNRGNHG